MTNTKRGRGDASPSLFPFLAVLLCTVGALVLMLVIIVGQSKASVAQAKVARAEKVEELRAQVEVIRDSFKDNREEIQLEIEKKRLSLQSLEKQTADLEKEMQELDKTIELVDKQLTSATDDKKADSALADLQKELEEAAKQLKDKLDKPATGKPVFAIIPYEGANGTRRRPIYLECRADGIVLQPEGIVIALKDLKPPYGPGNPLDAALRTIRTYYSPKGGALQTSAYPLLVVRSSGIRTYALARMAMAGWDDQFGYELIEDDMDLTFPPGEPTLARDLEQSLVAARNRQAALVMAMPGKYRQAMEELTDDKFNFDDAEWSDGRGGSSDEIESDNGSSLAGNSSGIGTSSNGSAGAITGDGKYGSGSGAGMGTGTGSPGDMNFARGRAGFAFDPSATQRPLGGAGSSANMSAFGSGSGMQGFASGGTSANGLTGTSNKLSANGNGLGNGNNGGLLGIDAQRNPTGADSFASGAFSGGQYVSGGNGQTANGYPGEAGGMQIEGNGKDAGTNARRGNFRDAMAAARAKRQDTGDATSGQPANGSETTTSTSGADGTGGSQMSSSLSEGFGSVAGNMSEFNAEAPVSPSMSANLNKKDKKKESSDAVAKRKGRNWAWSAGQSRQTAVVRSIRLVCYDDRWVLLPDAGSKDKPQTVMLDVAMQTSAEELAEVITKRVDRWGIALAGGYWKPVIEVEVAPRGEKRFEQLQRLMEGSGLDVQLANPASKSNAPAYNR